MAFQSVIDRVTRALLHPSLLTLCVSVTIGYIVAVATYRLKYHPLARFPGPLWARLSTIPSWWHTLHGDRHVWLWRLQEEYGSTFRYRPDSVLINTPSAYRTLFGPKGNIKKGVYYEAWPRNVDALTTWNSTRTDVHGRKRRVLNQAFSDRALRDAEPFVLSHTDRWCDLLEACIQPGREWSAALNMTDWVNHVVFDILGDLCFGESFGMKEPGSSLRYIPHLMTEFLELMHPIAFSPFVGLWVWFKPRGLDRLVAWLSPPTLKNWEDFVQGCLARRTKIEMEASKAGLEEKGAGQTRRDFFHYLYHAKDPETGRPGYGLAELYGECESLIIAGSDTTAIVLSAIFFYLARQPAMQARLAAEVRSAFASFDAIRSGAALRSCSYLHALVQEALRMTPPVSAELSREVLPGGTRLDGHFFPAGVNVSVGMYCLSYNKDVFPDPFRFRPERWIVDETGLAGDPPERVALAESGSCAFSFGSRACPGKRLAWMEMTTVMAKVIYRFELKQDPNNHLGAGRADGKPGRCTVDQYQTHDAFVSTRNGPMVLFKSRA